MKSSISRQNQVVYKSNLRCGKTGRCELTFLLLILACVLIFCNPLQAGSFERVVGMKDSGTTIEMRVGETLRIDLPGNAGTGFSWHFAQLDGNVFTLLGR